MINDINERVFIINPITEVFTTHLDELYALVESANGEVIGHIEQNVKIINPATFIGKGKLIEIKDYIQKLNIDLIVFNGVLSPSQSYNISEALDGIRVIDRTTLILDIFALNAKSAEGKLQVELAQLKYIYPRLKGKGLSMSRLGGTIGTRGPGETKLETDRRHIRLRLKFLSETLSELETRRTLQMDRRKKNEIPTIALIGYTNTGKSTLLNLLTNSNDLVKNKLFATLDPSIKKLKLKNQDALLIDTVGLVQDLPHDLVEAFKSTLESAFNADLILNISDASSPIWKIQYQTTLDTLKKMNCSVPILTVFNKCDLIDNFVGFPEDSIFISAKNNFAIDKLLDKISDELSSIVKNVTLAIPYEEFNLITPILKNINNTKYYYKDDFIEVNLNLSQKYYEKLKKYIISIEK